MQLEWDFVMASATSRMMPRARGVRLSFVLLGAVVSLCHFRVGYSFQPLLTVNSNAQRRILAPTELAFQRQASMDLSSGLISQLAEIALKLRLAGHTDVSCDVTARPSDLLLHGRVGPVSIRGKGWRSGRGLTCRAIEATVDTCELDVGRIVSQRKLSLNTPAMGRAMIALNSIDFANFITHPLMKPPSLSANEPPISFVKDGTIVDPETDSVVFFAAHEGEQWRCTLTRGSSSGKRAIVKVLPRDHAYLANAHSVCQKMADSLSCFFNEMIFELDGTFLSFRDMMVTDKGGTPSVMMALNIEVHKFPSPGLDF
jgi:hypothetical protein